MKPNSSFTWAATAVLALLPASLVAQPTLSGMWELTWETPRGAQSFEVSLEQTDMLFTGTAEGPMGEMPLKDGKLEGDKVSFMIEMTMGRPGGQGRTIEQVFEGVLKDGVIEGEMQMPAMGGRPGGAGGGGAGGGRGGPGAGPRTFKMVRAGG